MIEEANGRNADVEFQPSGENYIETVQRHRKILEFTADDKDGLTQKKQSKRYKNKWSLPQDSESEKKKNVGEESA